MFKVRERQARVPCSMFGINLTDHIHSADRTIVSVNIVHLSGLGYLRNPGELCLVYCELMSMDLCRRRFSPCFCSTPRLSEMSPASGCIIILHQTLEVGRTRLDVAVAYKAVEDRRHYSPGVTPSRRSQFEDITRRHHAARTEIRFFVPYPIAQWRRWQALSQMWWERGQRILLPSLDH